MLSFLHHLLFPTHKNNFRARILHNSSLLVIILFLLTLGSGVVFIKRANPSVLGMSYSITETELFNDTNAARVQNNEPPLVMNAELSDAARRKAADMFARDYWAHFAPDGTTPWSFIKAAGYDYSYAGENLAKGFTTSQDVVNAWMNSPSHRENLLSPKYKDIGLAVAEGTLQGEDTVLVVQMFGAPIGAIDESSVPVSVQGKANVPIQKPVVIDSGSERVAVVQNENKPVNSPIFDSQRVPKSLVTVFLAFIIIVLVLDIIVVEKKKIPRMVGHNMDHIILLAIFLLFIILTTNKGIL